MVSRNTISMNGNNFTHHDMVSRIKFLATEIALGTDKLLNDLFIRESINNAIVDIYGRLYDKLRYNYLSVAILDRDDPTDDYITCFPIQLIQVGTFPYKYGYIHKNDDKVGREISEILTMNILGFSSIQFAEPNMFEQIINNFNATYKQSCVYAFYQDYIELYIGEKLWQEYVDKLQPSIRMSYVRKPILDDLKKVHMNPKYEFEISGDQLSYFSENYNQPMDIPSEYNRLIEVLVMKDVYNGLGQPIPDNYDNVITSIIQQMIGVQNVGSNSAVPSGTE